MTPIQVLAVIFAVAVLIKITALILNPRLWIRMTRFVIQNKLWALLGYSALVLVTGYYIFLEMTIVQVGAAMLFASGLIGLGLLPYMDALIQAGDEFLESGIRKAWLPILVWTFLALWVLYAVFAQPGS